MTVSAFFSVSLEPPMVGVCLDNRCNTLAVVRETSHFGVNVLAENQFALSNRFAKTGNEAVRFDGLALHALEGAVSPMLEGAAAHMDCEVTAFQAAGDHTLCLGRVRAAATYARRPLLFHSGAYFELAPLRASE